MTSTSTNYRFNLTFSRSDVYNNFTGYMTIDPNDRVISIRSKTNKGIELVAGGTSAPVSFDTITLSGNTGESFTNTNYCILDQKQTLTTGGVYDPKVNTQNSINESTLNVYFLGSLILQPGFISNPPDGTRYWILETAMAGTSPVIYSIKLYYWTGPDDGGTATLVSSPTFVFSTTEALKPACFIKGTKLFAHVHDKDVYVNIEDLRSGDIINTYLHGKKPIKFIGKGTFTNNPVVWNHCVRRLPKSEDMIDDLLVTGAHSILVDELSAEETEGMIVIYGTADRKIDDKKLVLSWVSNKFEPVEDDNEYTYYHLVLEHDGDDEKRYGIWANGVLTESQSEKHFLKKPYEII